MAAMTTERTIVQVDTGTADVVAVMAQARRMQADVLRGLVSGGWRALVRWVHALLASKRNDITRPA